MRSATLAGTTGHVFTCGVRPSDRIAVEGVSEVKRREIAVRLRSALVTARGVPLTQSGTVTLDASADAACDLAAALALVPEYAHGADAALGELSLGGEVRAVRGVIPRLEALRDAGARRVLVSPSQLEAASVAGIEVLGLRRLGATPAPLPAWTWREPEYPPVSEIPPHLGEALEAVRDAVRGGRDVLLVREPGAGATLLARRVVGLLPALAPEAREEIAQIWSASGLPVSPALGRPFRAPHHTVSVAGLVGGTHPGEVTLAHGGVLFLDEVNELSRQALDALEDALDRSASHGMPAHPAIVIAACAPEALARVEKTFVRRFDRITLPRPSPVRAWDGRVG
jgi:magnesium chelatase family protein